MNYREHLLKHTKSLFILVFAALIASCGAQSETSGAQPTDEGETSNPGSQSEDHTNNDTNNNTNNSGGGNEEIVSTDPDTGVVTRKECNQAKDCRNDHAVCQDGKCYKEDDPCKNVSCGELERCEQGTGNLKDVGFCVPNCREDKQCAGKCSKDPNKVCVDYQWVDPCPTKHCATSSGLICCNSDEACVANACVTFGTECDPENEIYCKTTEYCDTHIKKCIEYAKTPSLCVFRPDNIKDTEVALSWSAGRAVYVTPLVINLDDDNNDGQVDKNDTPEIVFLKYGVGNSYDADLVVIRSQAGPKGVTDVTEVWPTDGVGDNGAHLYSDIAPAAADLDGDGVPEIVTLVNQHLVSNSSEVNDLVQTTIKAFHADGSKYFESPLSRAFHADAGGIAIGDITGDGHPEIVAVGDIFDYQGNRIFTLPMDATRFPNGGHWGAKNNLQSDVPVLADVNLDGYLDVVDGLMVFYYQQTTDGSFNMVQPTLDDGTTDKAERPYPPGSEPIGAVSAVANFEGDVSSFPEIVTVFNDKVFLADHRGKIIAEATAPAPNNEQWVKGGSPTIADFDGDGKPEIGAAFSGGFAVFDVERNDTTGTLELELLWYFKAPSNSDEITGASVFDFDADGTAEVVLIDIANLYVLNGNGEKNPDEPKELTESIIEIPNRNNAIWGASLEPIVADVDNDGHADIVASSSKGIKVFSNPKNQWVPTRPIWNQHGYNVTNIDSNGRVPVHEKKNWTLPWLNNFRQNVQEGNPFLATNFIAKAQIEYVNGCVSSSATADIRVNYQLKNIGDATATPNSVKIIGYTVQNGVKNVVFEQTNPDALPPNGEAKFSGTLTMDGSLATAPFDLLFEVDTEHEYNECEEDDNSLLIEGIASSANDLSVIIEEIDTLSCYAGDGSVAIKVKVTNNGKIDMPAGTLKVGLYATVGGEPESKLADVDVTDEIPANGSVTIDYDWTPFPVENQSKLIKVRAVIDEDNNVVECSETNNTNESQFYCQVIG